MPSSPRAPGLVLNACRAPPPPPSLPPPSHPPRGTASTYPDKFLIDIPALRRYYAQLGAASVTSTKLKLVVMGPGEAGKTSLIQRLRELESPDTPPQDLPARSDRTIGIEITTLQDTFVVHDFGKSSPSPHFSSSSHTPTSLPPHRRAAGVLPVAQALPHAGRDVYDRR